MRYILHFLFLSILIYGCTPKIEKASGIKSNNAQLSPSQLDTIQAVLQGAPNGAQLSIALLKDGQVNFTGLQREADTLKFVNNTDKLFEIGSISKTFTTALLSYYVAQGNIQLDTPIKDLLPVQLNQSKLNGKEITLKHLANHTSGLPRLPTNLNPFWHLKNPYEPYGKTELYEYLEKKMKIKTEPGKTYAYSNLGMALLGHILTLKMNNSYDEMVQEIICQPNDMFDTRMDVSNSKQEFVQGLNTGGEPTPAWNLNIHEAAGGLKSNARDMAKYIQLQLKDDSFHATNHVSTVNINDESGVGLGWHYRRLNSSTVWAHTGGTGGFTTCVCFDKSKQKGSIVLSNISPFSKQSAEVNKLCFRLLRGL